MVELGWGRSRSFSVIARMAATCGLTLAAAATFPANAHAQIESDLINAPTPDGTYLKKPRKRVTQVPAAAAAPPAVPGSPEAAATAVESTLVVDATPASPPPAPIKEPSEPTPIILQITGNKSLFRPGDTLVLEVKADQDCNLTLISIEGSGLATVLFPNEFEPDNRIAAGNSVHIPAATAAYVLRTNKTGIESVLAICTAVARRPFGIGHDYEQQRFTILGDWDAFTRTVQEHEAAYQAKIAEENKKRARKRKNPEPPIVDPPPGPREAEGRALLLLPVDHEATNEPTAIAPAAPAP